LALGLHADKEPVIKTQAKEYHTASAANTDKAKKELDLYLSDDKMRSVALQ
jgi:hypothetical protein